WHLMACTGWNFGCAICSPTVSRPPRGPTASPVAARSRGASIQWRNILYYHSKQDFTAISAKIFRNQTPGTALPACSKTNGKPARNKNEGVLHVDLAFYRCYGNRCLSERGGDHDATCGGAPDRG